MGLALVLTAGAGQAEAAPNLISVFPSNGPTIGNTRITLIGSSFSSSGNTVKVGTDDCLIATEGASGIECFTPAGSGASNSVVVTDSAGTPSNARSFSYDAPSLTSIEPTNGPAAGATQLTIRGANFGPATALRSATVDGQTCTLSSTPSTQTEIYCNTPAGTGLNKTVAVTVTGQAGTSTSLFNYDKPVVSGIDPSPGPKAGGVTITVQGSNFGPASTPRTIVVGGSVCPVVAGQDSDSAVTCTLPAGEGTNRTVSVFVAGQANNGGATFSYSGPAITAINPANGPTVGGTQITINGSNFSNTGNAISVDGQACTPVTQSYTSIRCTVPAGTGAINAVVVTDAPGQPSNSKNFGYDSPTVSSVTPGNGPTSGNTRLTINGTNFGPPASDGVRSVSVNGATCGLVPGVNTQNQIKCDTPAGSGVSNDVRVTIDGLSSSANSFFSYDAPSIASIAPLNGPTAGSNTLTLTGSNFGPSGNSVSVGGKTCTVTLNGTSSVECTMPAGLGTAQTVRLTVAGQSSNTKSYDYDKPVVSGLTPSTGPKAGGTELTIQGANFGPAGTSRQISVNGQACPPTSTADGHGAITCTLPPGQGTNLAVSVTAGLQTNTGGATFSYDGPAVSSIDPASGPTTGNTPLTIHGSDFSVSGNSVSFDGAACPIVTEGRSQIVCTLPPGTGAANPVSVSDAVGGSSNAKSYAFDAPTVSNLTPGNGPTAGNVPLTIQGTNFGPASADSVRSVTLNGRTCTPVSGQSGHFTIKCTLPSGSGLNRGLALTVDGQSADTAALSFNYDAPSALALSPSNGPTAGSVPLTINGTNFAPDGNGVSVGGRTCTIETESVSSIVCSLPEGTGAGRSVVVDADGQDSNAPLFNYDPPVLTSLDPGNGPTAGNIALTIRGLNFGAASADSVRSVTVGTAPCSLVPGASSHEAIECTLPPGQGLGNTVHVDVDSRAGNDLTFGYDAPQITSITPASPPEAGGVPITIHGADFGLVASASVGGNVCPRVSQTHSSFVCTLPPGSGSVPVSLFVSGQQAQSTLDYKARVCGDGAVDPGEDCDDDNTTDLDGCSAACETEHVQSKDQGACILALNKAGAGVAKAQAKGIADCAKDATAGVACIGASEPAGVTKAREKAASSFAKKCTALPDFGPVDATVMSDAAVDAEIALARDILGTDADAALVPNAGGKPRTACQQDVRAAWEKMVAASLKTFGACKKNGLKENTIRAKSQLEACLGYFDEGKDWDKAAAGLTTALADSCTGVDLADALPGTCASATDREACIRVRVLCNTCHLLVIGDHLDEDCDLLDDGAANSSCN